MKRFILTLCILALWIGPLRAQAELVIPSVFSDGMVLQREKPIPVWGWTDPGTRVSVRIGVEHHEAIAGQDGRWQVNLPAMRACAEPRELTIATGEQSREIHNVLVGEVWLASGQSNMFWLIRNCDRRSRELMAADELPLLRTFLVEIDHTWQPQKSAGGRWITSDDKSSLNGMSGIPYFFARKLHLGLKVPVGIISASEGGSQIEVWIPPEGLATQPLLADYLEQRRLARGDDPASSGLELHRHGTGNYEAMIAPFVPYAMRGFIWHQGENNARDGDAYRIKLHALIKGWRTVWKDDDLYFGIGQLYAFNAPYLDTWELRQKWVETQFAQYQAGTEVENARCAVLTDVSTPENIHPQNKWEAGERYAAAALHDVYGKGDVPGGPEIRSATWDHAKNRVVLDFAHIGDGLTTRDGHDLKWFEIGNNEGQWIGARALFSEDRTKVYLRSNGIGRIGGIATKARHAWMNIAMPNLVNSANYPASAFEMDVKMDGK